MREIPQLEKKSGCALVLSGGATKAFYFHLGVLKVLRPTNVTAIVGTSAGSVLGTFIAAGASIDTLLGSLHQKRVYVPKFDSWVRTLTSSMLFRPKYKDITKQSLYTTLASIQFFMTLPGLFRKDIVAEALDRLVVSQSHVSGFFDASALEDLFQSLLPTANFADLDTELYIIATGLDNHKRAVFNGRYDFEDETNIFMTDVPIHKAVRASSAIPGMFEPVKIKGDYYIDGEVKQTLSADIGVRLADQVVISHTYQPLFLNGRGTSVRDMGWLSVLKQATSMVFQERISVWRQIYQREHPDKEIIWIEPSPDDIDFFLAPEFSFRSEVQKKMIKSGENAAKRALMEQVRS